MNFYKTQRWKRKREKILRRDQYECQECKRYGKSKEASMVHHINSLLVRPDLKLTSWNLLSLCSSCHDKMHNRVTDNLTELGRQWQERVTPLTLKPNL